MTSIFAAMLVMIAIPLAIAALFSFYQALRRATAGDALAVSLFHADGREDQVELEFEVAPPVRAVTIERVVLDREFAARVLAQPPRGFRERHPAPPPDYAKFEPDLGHLGEGRYISRHELEAEKRRQHTDLVNTWADMCESMMTWEGRLTVRRGRTHRVVVPMRTDVAASGRITVIYSYRNGLIRSTTTLTTDYRPRLIAVHG
jgi:hypothetical protein